MAELATRGLKVRTGLVVSLLLHLAFIATAILSLPHWLMPSDHRGIEVTLLPLQTPAPRPPVRRSEVQRTRPATMAPAATAPPQFPQAVMPAAPAASAQAGPDVEAQARVTAMLRGSVGCGEIQFARLTPAEQIRCAKWLRSHETPGLEILAPMAANKRAWLDATVAARNAPDHPPLGGCFGKKPPHAIKLGPLPCYVDPPKGPFSEDVDAPVEPEREPGR